MTVLTFSDRLHNKREKTTDGQEKDFRWTLHSSFYVETAFSLEESKTWDLAKGNAWENGK